jgi:DNA mismatch endonuclease, patch repair protein
MVDKLTPKQRSRNMGKIRSKDTSPEMVVRKLVHRLGYRYRLHRKDLPGKPDLTFPSKKKLIFVHGCFWHQHQASSCKIARLPKSKTDYWIPKLQRNAERDIQHRKALKKMGWNSLVIWECETYKMKRLEKRIDKFLSSKNV